MPRLKSESLKIAIKDLMEDGIFFIEEIAQGLGYTPNELKDSLTDDIIIMCGQVRIAHKAKLNRIVFMIAESGSDEDNTRFNAARYLLCALHDQSESASYYKAKLHEEKQKRQINQTIKAAQLATTWDEATTLKFIDTVRNIGDVLQ